MVLQASQQKAGSEFIFSNAYLCYLESLFHNNNILLHNCNSIIRGEHNKDSHFIENARVGWLSAPLFKYKLSFATFS